MTSVAIIDYGVGNLRSVEKAFAAVGIDAVVTDDKEILRSAEKLVLPGVGAFGACMQALDRHGFINLVLDAAQRGTPLLGVCVGMQMLFEESEEFGRTKGLGLLKGSVHRFDDQLCVPHMGWNQVSQKAADALFESVENDSFFYFVHSYYCQPSDEVSILGKTDYGVSFASVVKQENICGVQFHPEKSQDAGLRLLKNFAVSDKLKQRP
jgi:imidazole glycerol-phosphate synthase subunit HisH